MFDFRSFFLNAPLTFVKRFLGNPISVLFYGIISKWYLILATLSIVILYWVVKGLDKVGLIDSAFDVFQDAGKQMKGFVQHCTPKILDLNEFLKCMNNTPEYTGDETTNFFEQEIGKDLEEIKKHPVNHDRVNILSPYEKMLEINTPKENTGSNDVN